MIKFRISRLISSQRIKKDDIMTVSIMINVYNCEEYLAECLESVCSQRYPNIQIICVNDGSTDNSEHIIMHYQQLDKRIEVINQRNSGVSSARNQGLKVATGDYVLFVDADDILMNNAIEVMAAYTKNGAEFIIPKYTREYNKTSIERDVNSKIVESSLLTRVLLDFYRFNSEVDPRFQFLDEWVLAYCPGRLIQRKLLKGVKFSERLIYGEDVIFNIDVLSACKEVCLLDSVLYYYRPNEKSVTASKYQPYRLRNTLYLVGEINKRVKKMPYLRDAANEFILGRVMHCYSQYFPFSKNSWKEQQYLISRPVITKAVLAGRDRGYKRSDFLKAKLIAHLYDAGIKKRKKIILRKGEQSMFKHKKNRVKNKETEQIAQEKPIPTYLRPDYPYQAVGEAITDINELKEGVLYEIKCPRCEMSIRSQGQNIGVTYERLLAGSGCLGCGNKELVIKRVEKVL